MTTFDENGFIEGRIHLWMESRNASHQSIFHQAKQLNRDCHHFLDGRAVDVGDQKQVASAVLFARLLELYQAIIVVSERGMTAATRITLRSFLEASFHFFAIQRDSTYLKDYLDQFLIQKRKLLQRMRQSTSPSVDDLRLAATDELLAQTVEAISQNGARPISTEESARRAQMHDTYITAYSILSHAVHTGVSDVDSHIEVDGMTKDIVGFRYGPSEAETSRAICLSGMTLAEALESVSQNFREDRTPLCSTHKEAFQSLLDTAA